MKDLAIKLVDLEIGGHGWNRRRVSRVSGMMKYICLEASGSIEIKMDKAVVPNGNRAVPSTFDRQDN